MLVPIQEITTNHWSGIKTHLHSVNPSPFNPKPLRPGSSLAPFPGSKWGGFTWKPPLAGRFGNLKNPILFRGQPISKGFPGKKKGSGKGGPGKGARSNLLGALGLGPYLSPRKAQNRGLPEKKTGSKGPNRAP